MKENKLNYLGIVILICLFCLFYFISNYFLSKKNENKVLPEEVEIIEKNLTYEEEISILNNLYADARILYDVVNNKFTVSQDDIIIIGDITYKKITNFDTVMNNIFTEDGVKNYIETLKKYFAYSDNSYYLAGNLVSYQTYIFRGDNTNLYVTNASDDMIEGIIYEKRSSNEKSTLATIKVIKKEKWLIDDIKILYSDGVSN